MDILDDMGVSKLSAKVSLKVNYSFKCTNTIDRVVFIALKHMNKPLVLLLMCLSFHRWVSSSSNANCTDACA